MQRCFLAVVLAVTLANCTSVHSNKMIMGHGRAITEIQYQEVLDNLAMVKKYPGVLPWHVTISGGSVQAQGTLSPSFAYGWPNISRALGLSGAYQQQHGWNLVPFDDPKFLKKAIRIYADAATESWVREGVMPSSAKGFSGTYEGTHIWVASDDVSKLTEVVLKLLDAEITTPPGPVGSGKSKSTPTGSISPKIQSKLSAPMNQQMLIRPD